MVVILKMSKCVFNYLLLAAQVSIIRTGRPIGIIFSESKSGFYILKKKKAKKDIITFIYCQEIVSATYNSLYLVREDCTYKKLG